MRMPLLILAIVTSQFAGAAQPPRGAQSADSLTTIVLARPVLDSMNLIFTQANEHWNELADLNWMERSLGTVRPTQREYLGCLLGEVRGDTLVVDDWKPARDMKRLMLAVTGDCSGLARYVGTFHNHPYLADSQNRATKQRFLAPQDLQSFEVSDDLVAMVIWDPDSLDAALRTPSGGIVRDQPVVVR